MSKGNAIGLFALMFALVSASGGCTFEHRWESFDKPSAHSVSAVAAPGGSDLLAGRWEGRWISDASGHSGSLRAIITPIDQKTYRADFSAMFFSIFRFDHGTDLTATYAASGKLLSFEGQENLGSMAGGVYRYKGTTDGVTFQSNYESGADHGRFEMKRPTK